MPSMLYSKLKTLTKFYSVIWSKCPKKIFFAKTQVQIAASIAISEYNFDTKRAVIEFFKQAGIRIDTYTISIAEQIEKRRLGAGIQKLDEKFKRVRWIISKARYEREQKDIEKEGSTYSAGMFWKLQHNIFYFICYEKSIFQLFREKK